MRRDLLGMVVLEGLGSAVHPVVCVGLMVGGAQVVLQIDNAWVVAHVAEGALT